MIVSRINLERCGRHSAIRIVVYLLVFVLAGLAACETESLRAREATRYSGTATLRVPAAWFQGRRQGQTETPACHREAIEQEIASLEPGLAGHDIEVSVSQPVPDRVEIAITCIRKDPRSATEFANRLAAAYASQRRAEVAREAAEGLAALVAGRDGASRILQETGSEIEAIIDRSMSQPAVLSTTTTGSPATEPRPDSFPFLEEQAGIPSVGAAPENAELADARATLAEFQDRRRNLLLSRTPLHPEVRNLDLRIADAEKQLALLEARADRELAAAPQRKTPPAPIKASPTGKPTIGSSPGVAPLVCNMKTVEDLRALKARVEQAACRAGQPTPAEAQARLRLADGESIEIIHADRPEAIRAQVGVQDWLAVVLAAGLVGTAGFGMVWSGVQIDPPFESADQIEGSLRIPVIGTIPVPGIAAGARGRSHASASKWSRIAAGAAVMAAYLAFLLAPLVAG